MSTLTFMDKSRLVHGNKYIYTKVNYVTAKTKVVIICPKHGEFEQTPTNHLSGKGCSKCAKEIAGTKLRKTTQQFIEEASIKHNNLYTYSKTTYKGNKEKVIITCPVHGDFTQEAKSHLSGNGCAKCANKSKKGAWSYAEWEQAGFQSNNFLNFTLYVVECWNENERFIKIGKTFTSLGTRFSGLPYEWKVHYTVTGSARYISNLETLYHKSNTLHKYSPTTVFKGHTECFTTAVLNNLKELNHDLPSIQYS